MYMRFVPSAVIQKSAIRMHVHTSFFQLLIRRKQLRNRINLYAKRLHKLANRTLTKRLVGEMTVT